MTDGTLTCAAVEGYILQSLDGVAKNPHLFSSPMWLAFEAGRYLAKHARRTPADVGMGRGYRVRGRGFVLKFEGDVLDTVIDESPQEG